MSDCDNSVRQFLPLLQIDMLIQRSSPTIVKCLAMTSVISASDVRIEMTLYVAPHRGNKLSQSARFVIHEINDCLSMLMEFILIMHNVSVQMKSHTCYIMSFFLTERKVWNISRR